MINLIPEVSPETRAILWFTKANLEPQSKYYKSIDYLTDGVLTASLRSQSGNTNHVLIGENFGSTLFILIAQELKDAEIKSFMDLIKKDFAADHDILVIDESESLPKLKKLIPPEISSKFKILA